MDGSLFIAAFISATLLPGGSEALLLFRIHEGGNPWALVAVATLGNVLGSLLTYGLGRGGNAWLHQRRWLRISASQLAKAELWFGRYGQGSLLLAWLPIVGDPLCLVAGLLRCHWLLFLLLVTAGKLVRYSMLAWWFV